MSRGFVKEDDQEEIPIVPEGIFTGGCNKLCYPDRNGSAIS